MQPDEPGATPCNQIARFAKTNPTEHSGTFQSGSFCALAHTQNCKNEPNGTFRNIAVAAGYFFPFFPAPAVDWVIGTMNSAPLSVCRARAVVASVETSKVSEARGNVVYWGGGL